MKAGKAPAAPRLFGTNGVRGVVNTQGMDCEFAMRLGLAIGTYMKGTVMIGTDARTSNDMLRSACSAGLMASGCDVLDCGLVPTPTLQYAVKMNKVAGGVMITASHNPPEFNGIKCIDPDGTEMARSNEERIEALYHSMSFRRAEWSGLGRTRTYNTAIEEYIDGIVSRLDTAAIRKAKLRVAVDCSNGAASFVTPRLLERLGVRYVTLNADPNGAFPGHNSEPTPDNTKDIVDLVKAGGFDLGFVHDGDADRTIFVDDRGRYMYGDRSLALVAHYACLEKRGGLVVTSVGSSMCVEDAAKLAGGRVEYTMVGSPIVARAMMDSGAVFGGEENGGLIFPELQYCRDGAMSAAKVLEIVAKHGRLSDLLDRIPSYAQYKTKTKCPDDRKQDVMRALAATAKGDRVDTTDGVKIFSGKSWVLVRPSGTEPIFRVFSEARTPEEAKDIAESYKKRVEELVAG
ncbi:MAG: phosphomannomutase / phosphoglucomutase [Candidatus Thermoplasmatota archaeon]|nr:phosphomannomutase / phosphoglucomutase [Candidatus Thermoplasmatota archaeon]